MKSTRFFSERQHTSMDSSIRVAVIGHSQTPKNKTLYRLRVIMLNFSSDCAAQQWTVLKRFSEFHHLHVELKKVVQNSWLPRIPPKKVFGSNKIDFLDKRWQKLDEYIKAVLRSAASREVAVAKAVRCFLGCDWVQQTNMYKSNTNKLDSNTAAFARSNHQATEECIENAETAASEFCSTFSLCPFCIVSPQKKKLTWLTAKVKVIRGSQDYGMVPQKTSFVAGSPKANGTGIYVSEKSRGVWLSTECRIHGGFRTL